MGGTVTSDIQAQLFELIEGMIMSAGLIMGMLQPMPLLKILSLIGVSDAEDISSIFKPHHGEPMVIKSSNDDKKANRYFIIQLDELHIIGGPAIARWLNDLEHAIPQLQKVPIRLDVHWEDGIKYRDKHDLSDLMSSL
jgi:hypothetical protein